MKKGKPCDSFLLDIKVAEEMLTTNASMLPCYWCGWEQAWHLDKAQDLDFPLTYWETKFLSTDP